MSVIGTTLKQPRVFAHDAVALKDLPGCIWRGVKGFEDPLTNAGTLFTVGDVVEGFIKNPGNTLGNGVTIVVQAVDPGGEITEYEIVECKHGSGYNVGDVITFLSPGGGTAAVATVEDLLITEWDYGCPFTTMNMALTENPLYADQSNDIPDVGQPLEAFLQKTKYVYTCECGEEEAPCNCEYETPGPGAALYIGWPCDTLTVIMESEKKVTYNNVPQGTFMPISCLTVCAVTLNEPEGVEPPDAKSVILALF